MKATSQTVSQLAVLVGGSVVGAKDVTISTLVPLDEPKPDAISFTKETHPRKLGPLLSDLKVAALIISDTVDPSLLPSHKSFIRVKDPLAALIKIVPLFVPAIKPSGVVSDKADIHPSAKIGKNVSIGAFVAIGADVVIEDGVVVHPHVTLYQNVFIGAESEIHSGAVIREYCKLGPRTIIQNGAIIGADGFGYLSEHEEGSAPKIVKVPQVGIVNLGPDTEVGANTCIDRATLGTTQVGPSTKIDNLVQVGHNTKIGAFTIVCGKVGIAGSSRIGNGVVLGGDVGIKDHTTIADGVRVAARSGVISDLTEKGDYAGFPAVRALAWRRQIKAIGELQDIIDDARRSKKEQK